MADSKRLSIPGCELVKQKRLNKKLTIQAVATKVHIGESTVKRFFGRTAISSDLFIQICNFLDVSWKDVEEKSSVLDEKKIREEFQCEYKDKLEHTEQIYSIRIESTIKQLDYLRNHNQVYNEMIINLRETNKEQTKLITRHTKTINKQAKTINKQAKTIANLVKTIDNHEYIDGKSKYNNSSPNNNVDSQKNVTVNINNSGTGSVSMGDTFNTIHYHKQDLAEAAAEIQRLLEQLEKTSPTNSNYETTYSANSNYETTYSANSASEKLILASRALQQIENNPTFKKRVINALKEGGDFAFQEAINHPLANIVVAAIQGWLMR